MPSEYSLPNLTRDLAAIPVATLHNRALPDPDHALPATAADSDLDFLSGAVELAAGFDDGDHVTGLRHLDAVGHTRHRAGRNLVRCHQRVRIVADQKRD